MNAQFFINEIGCNFNLREPKSKKPTNILQVTDILLDNSIDKIPFLQDVISLITTNLFLNSNLEPSNIVPILTLEFLLVFLQRYIISPRVYTLDVGAQEKTGTPSTQPYCSRYLIWLPSVGNAPQRPYKELKLPIFILPNFTMFGIYNFGRNPVAPNNYLQIEKYRPRLLS